MGRAAGGNRLPHVSRRAPRRGNGRSAPWQWRDDEYLERALRDFTAGRTTWPTRSEFDDEGRADLRVAVDVYGGFEYWAARLGLELSARQLGAVPYTDSDARRDAGAVIELFGRLPNSKALRAAGFGRLATRVEAAGGAARFLGSAEGLE